MGHILRRGRMPMEPPPQRIRPPKVYDQIVAERIHRCERMWEGAKESHAGAEHSWLTPRCKTWFWSLMAIASVGSCDVGHWWEKHTKQAERKDQSVVGQALWSESGARNWSWGVGVGDGVRSQAMGQARARVRSREEEQGPGARQECRNQELRRIWDEEGGNLEQAGRQGSGIRRVRVQRGSQPRIHLVAPPR